MAGAGIVAGLGAWGLFEAQWLERRHVDVPVGRLPRELDGLRIGHLSDMHLGSVSQNGRTFDAAVEWLAEERPDLVCVTGDLLARARGEEHLRRGLAALDPPYGTYAVLGNVDVADTRDPFSTEAHVPDVTAYATLLSDTAVHVEIEGRDVAMAGLAAWSRERPPAALGDEPADLRILLAHFPDSADRLRRGRFDLVLSGHTHGGQICLPGPRGRLHLAELTPPFRPPYSQGVFDVDGTTLVVSRGTGTTFVPFRLLARPEVAVLVLRPA